MNRVTIEPTKFENQRSGEITFGFVYMTMKDNPMITHGNQFLMMI